MPNFNLNLALGAVVCLCIGLIIGMPLGYYTLSPLFSQSGPLFAAQLGLSLVI